MRRTSILLNRRLVLGFVAAPLIAFPARAWFARPEPTDYEARLVAWLAELPLPAHPAELGLLQFSVETSHGATQMQAVVELTWPPGKRRRPFMALAGDPEYAFSALCDAIGATFSEGSLA